MKQVRIILTGMTLFGLLAFSSLCAANANLEADAGQHDWQRAGLVKSDAEPRRCSTCHGKDLTRAGRHIRTGKRIEPMAVSVNPERLTDSKKIAKWFKRNCKWTWGRECTATEKRQFITYIKQQ